MKVIVAGFTKTGTNTMSACLAALGYKVYGYEQNFFYLRNEWTKILTKGGSKEDFYNMYKDIDAGCDIPFCIFWEEILEAFPDAKIIFMKRKSEDDWLRSWMRQADNVEKHPYLSTLAFLSPTAFSMFKYSRHVGRVAFCSTPQAFFACYRGISSTVAKKRYRDHNNSILTRAPKDQLLLFSLSDGWGPMCDFLEKPIPNFPFPHRNQRATIVEDYMRHSPIFHRMKQEAKITLTGFGILATIGLLYLARRIVPVTIPMPKSITINW
ncbi:uncharacterized protein LOC120346451 isoform X1 [Styela clava]|uniref:uncharacterized protein LOC120346451 isoform X1 n=1 Tax=Styela clava TaxID=7725 RepID=UPI00193AD2E2|nr:uncharacterized protein LOC120346451 isoform X1 [Styela clava]